MPDYSSADLGCLAPYSLASSYIGYTIINALDISWLYIWGNLYIDAASAVLFLFQVFYYPTLAMLIGYLYKVRIRSRAHKIDVLLT